MASNPAREACAVCRGTGYEIRYREDGVSVAARCSCQAALDGEARLRAAGVPRRYAHCLLESFETQGESLRVALSKARGWVEAWPLHREGLLFRGVPGTGKTHLVVGMARELLGKGARLLFREQRELLKQVQSTFDAGSLRSESEVLGEVLGAEVLILDDLGAGRTTAWARDVMHDVIAHRYNERLPILITTNLSLGEEDQGSGRGAVPEGLTLRDRLGDALMSRLYEMCEIIEVQGGKLSADFHGDFRRGVKRARSAT